MKAPGRSQLIRLRMRAVFFKEEYLFYWEAGSVAEWSKALV